MQKLTLAKAIHEMYPDHFTSVEEIRKTILYYTGSSGKKKLQSVSDKYLTADKIAQKYNIPKSIAQDSKPHILTGNKGLIFSDIHIPFHSVEALSTMFDYTCKNDYDFVLINGDLMDMYELSTFDKQPGLDKIKDEIEMTKQFLDELKCIYPKARIILKASNHEKRMDKYICRKAPELYGLEALKLESLLDLFNKGISYYGLEALKLESLLDLFNKGISYIDENKYIDLSGLTIMHGHEVKFGGGENPAQQLYRKIGVTALTSHFHRISQHSHTRLGKELDKTWSIGCMCGLHPEYAEHNNNWQHGFAEYEMIDETYWHIHNRTILNGRVV
jgi:hypothetical protein